MSGEKLVPSDGTGKCCRRDPAGRIRIRRRYATSFLVRLGRLNFSAPCTPSTPLVIPSAPVELQSIEQGSTIRESQPAERVPPRIVSPLLAPTECNRGPALYGGSKLRTCNVIVEHRAGLTIEVGAGVPGARVIREPDS